jgi:thiamine biosynthesis lipoprotein
MRLYSKSDAAIRRARPLLGTLVEISATGRPEPRLRAAVNQAFAAIEKVQRLMSYHEQDSDVSRLNRAAKRRPVRVHAWTRTVLRRSLQLHAATNGIFDIAVGPILERGGWLPVFAFGSNDAGNTSDVVLLKCGRVRFRREIRIDLGGIAKGFAVDKAVEVLRRHGVVSAVVNAGGDLRVLGRRPELVHVRLPESPGQVQPLVTLRDSALATSAYYFSQRTIDGVRRSPIFDPRTLQLSGKRLSVSVQAPKCWLADALCKVVWLAGAAALPLLEKHGACAWVLDARVARHRRKEMRRAA